MAAPVPVRARGSKTSVLVLAPVRGRELELGLFGYLAGNVEEGLGLCVRERGRAWARAVSGGCAREREGVLNGARMKGGEISLSARGVLFLVIFFYVLFLIF